MKRLHHSAPVRFAALGLLLTLGFTAPALAGVPTPNGATIQLRVFNDCPTTQIATINSYPTAIVIDEVQNGCGAGFANRHIWRFSEDGGATEAVFNNGDCFCFASSLILAGNGQGEGGIQLTPWFSQDVDGVLFVNTVNGEIAAFGGRLPFYSFTVNHGITYTKGTEIRLGMCYDPNGLSEADPGTIEYTVTYNAVTYSSGPLAFDSGFNPMDPPHGVWGIQDDARAGGYVQQYLAPPDVDHKLTASWTNIDYDVCPTAAVPTTWGSVKAQYRK